MKTKIFVMALLAVLILISCSTYYPKTAEGWRGRGNSACYNRNFKEAIKCYDKAIEIKSDDHIAFFLKGDVFYDDLNDLDKAMKFYNIALKIKPDYFNALNSKGILLIDLGHYEDALKCFDNILNSIKTEYSVAWSNKGSIYRIQHKYEKSIECYKKVEEVEPDDQFNLYNMTEIYSLMKNKIELFKHLRRLFKMTDIYKEHVRKDTIFKEYWDDPDFIELTKDTNKTE